MRKLHIYGLLLLVMSYTFAASLGRAADPSLEWRTIETEHFKIIFDSKHYDLAKLYAVEAEQAFKAVAPAFGTWPEKTSVVIDDSYDFTNGAASGVPYPRIISLPVLPSPLETIGDYGDWGLELLTHEYTHILTFEPATGGARPLRWIFGSIIRPNALLPRWYLEGLAVYMETRYSRHGRLRSANYLSIPRALLEDDRLFDEDISRINEVGIPDFPGGDRPYLMGALLWNEMIHEKGESIIGDLNRDYSRRFPFFIDGPARAHFGVGYQTLLDRAYDHTETNARKQVAVIQAAGKIGESAFERKGIANYGPTVSPDGLKLISIINDSTALSFVNLIERDSLKESFNKKSTQKYIVHGRTVGTTITHVAWLPDSMSFIYDTLDDYDRYYLASDLWRADIIGEKGHRKTKRTQLTHGLRAREASISPDGKTLAFVQLSAGATALGVVGVDGAGAHTVYVPALQVRVSGPEFLSNNEIIYTERTDQGIETMRVLKLAPDAQGVLQASGAPRDVLMGFRPAHLPHVTSEGVLFTSDKSGVANLYLANRDLSDARAVTNTTTRVVTGDIDRGTGELIYSRLTSKGPFLYSSSSADWHKVPKALPQVASLVDTEWPSYDAPRDVKVDTASDDYNPFPYLVPRYWFPWVYFAPGATYYQASTSASDPVGHHLYSLAAAYDTLTERPNFAGEYVNATTRVPLALFGEDYYEHIYNGDFNRHTSTGAAEGLFFIPHLNNDWHGGLGWVYLQQELFGEDIVRNGARVSLKWSNAFQAGPQISPEIGGSLLLAHTRYFAGLGNIDYEQTDVGATAYISRWLTDIWPKRHVLALSVRGSFAPRLGRSILGESNVAGSTATGIIPTGFVMRGYGSGVFLGRNLIAGTAEYRFPIVYSYRGFGTSPLFINRLHADVFVDALTLDGLAYDHDADVYHSEKIGTPFYGVGGELKLDTTAFYQAPLQILLGAYYGTDRRYNPYGLFPFVGISL